MLRKQNISLETSQTTVRREQHRGRCSGVEPATPSVAETIVGADVLGWGIWPCSVAEAVVGANVLRPIRLLVVPYP